MTKHRFGLSWISLGLFAGALGIVFGACTRVESDDDDDDDDSGQSTTDTGDDDTGGNAGGSKSTGAAASKGGTTAKVGTTATGAGSTTGSTPSNTTKVTVGGAGSQTGVMNSGVQACMGVESTAIDENAAAAACNGVSIEAEPIPVDMIILMDRSISNSYAVGSETATPAGGGQTRRWDVLTAAMEALATSEDAKNLGASLTLFSYTGGANPANECNVADYEKPVVPLALLGDVDPATGLTQGQKLVNAMQAVTPGGLTPTVPALTGVFKYAMAEKNKPGNAREKVVVLISDGFPTLCDEKSPSDIANVIKEAAGAITPIRTFIIGVGSPDTMDGARFNLLNYASSGNTGKPPYVLDEAAGADAVRTQLVQALLNISSSTLACDYELTPPQGWVISPEDVSFTWKPSAGNLQQIPRVTSEAACQRSANGGFYFDDPVNPTKITACPCTCANFGAGRGTILYGCKPILVIE